VTPATVVAGALLATGAALMAVAALGLVRLPDVYHRMNAVAKAASLGLVCVLLGVLVLMPSWRNAAVIGAAVLLQLFTAPVGGFALARAAYRAGAPLARITCYDRLAGPAAGGPGGPPSGPPDQEEDDG